ncbi:MAG: hypothetical protein ACRD0F_04195 [Acidimicrobiales bacterium]
MAVPSADRPPVDLEGPVEAEVFVVFHRAGTVHLTGPCGPAPWRIESRDRHPIDLVRAMAEAALGPLMLVHSTSWRWERAAVVLSFLVVVDPARAAGLGSVPVERADLARSTATEAPASIALWQVLEHALRHLAWLAREDGAAGATLPQPWAETLAGYVPEPFRQLDVGVAAP